MEKKLKVLMVGAHPDDNDICGGGLAIKYASAGHEVRFLSVCNGCGGHHVMKPDEIAKRRYGETQAVAALAGITYDVWDIPDCAVMADLETRNKLIVYIREFCPDIIFTHRTNDYHADHRNAAMLVQDASYLLTVPNLCPEAPAMRFMPVIMYFRDHFKNPPFVPDMIVDIDDVIDKKYGLWNCHVSQFYEWLPYTYGTENDVPEGEAERLEWLHSPRVPRDKVLPLKVLEGMTSHTGHGESVEAKYAALYRKLLVKRYGAKGKKVVFAEAYETSEYGTQLTKENIDVLFPF